MEELEKLTKKEYEDLLKKIRANSGMDKNEPVTIEKLRTLHIPENSLQDIDTDEFIKDTVNFKRMMNLFFNIEPVLREKGASDEEIKAAQDNFLDNIKKGLAEKYGSRFQKSAEAIIKLTDQFKNPISDNDFIWGFFVFFCLQAVPKNNAKDNKPKLLEISNLPNLLITDEHIQNALTPIKNQYAYIMPLDFDQLKFDFDEDGEIIITSEAQIEAQEKAKKNDIIPTGIDQPLLRQLFSATVAAYLSNYGNSITVSLPSFASEMGIDVSTGLDKEKIKHKSNDFFKKIKDLERLGGVWQDGGFTRVFYLEEYDAKNKTITFSSPWLFKIAKELFETPSNKRTKRDGTIIWEMTGISRLQKATIASARSKPTVEIIASLIAGIHQRGLTPDSKLGQNKGKKYKAKDMDRITFSISIKTLIERIPIISESIKFATSSNITHLLHRYFCGKDYPGKKKTPLLKEYIWKYTLLPQYYKDFEIDFDPPTVQNLSAQVTITHHGIDPYFKSDDALAKLIHQKEDSISPENNDTGKCT